MKITPIEIRQKDFQKAFRGYEKEEVDAFLMSLSQEWERAMEDNKDLRRKLDHAERELSRLKEVEASLFKTLKTAEDTGAHMIDHATKTAELHLKEAQMNAEGLMNEAKSKAKAMLEEAEDKAKNIIEEMQDEAKTIQKEFHYLQDQRDNLLQELKNIANDTLEKVSRVSAKRQGLEEKLKEFKSLAIDKKESDTQNVGKDTSSSIPPAQENSPKENSGSFFDSIQ